MLPGASLALLLIDRATGFKRAHPTARMGYTSALGLLRHVHGSGAIKTCYSCTAHELTKAMPKMGWRCSSVIPGERKSGGIVERAVGRAKVGARSVFFAEGLRLLAVWED